MTLGLRSVLLGTAVMLVGSGVAHAQTATAPPSAGAQAEVGTGAAPAASAGAQVDTAPAAGAEAQVGAAAAPGAGAEAQVSAGTAPSAGAEVQGGPRPMQEPQAQVGAAPGMEMEEQAAMAPPRHWHKHRPVGGHIGVAVPIAVIAKDSEVIGDDFVDLGLASGVTARINPCWFFNFEFIAFDALKSEHGPTRLVVDPGVFRAWGTFAAGLRAAVVVGAPNVNNFGLVPVLNKAFTFSDDSPVGMYLELDLPVFFSDAEDNHVTFTPQVQVGTSF